MNEQQLMKTIEDQNQVIIAKDATIDNLRKDLRDAKCKLNELYLDRSYKKICGAWATEAMHQKAVKVIGNFQYNTRYISLENTIWILFAGIAITTFVLTCIR